MPTVVIAIMNVLIIVIKTAEMNEIVIVRTIATNIEVWQLINLRNETNTLNVGMKIL